MKSCKSQERSSFWTLVRAAISTFNVGSLLFFCLHCICHLFFYTVPTFLYNLSVRWPLSAVEYVFLAAIAPHLLSDADVGRLLKTRFERRRGRRVIKVVAHPKCHATLEAFGLSKDNLYRNYQEAGREDFCAPLVENTNFVSHQSSATGDGGKNADLDTAKNAADRTYKPLLYTGPLYDGNFHTILGSFRSFDYLTYQRETIRSFDGNPICLDYLFPETEVQRERRVNHRSTVEPRRRRNIKALVVVLPGLTGTSREFYVQRMAKALYNAHNPDDNEDDRTTANAGEDAVAPSDTEQRHVRDTGGRYLQAKRRREYNNIQVVVLNARGVGNTPLEQPQIFSALFTKDLRFILENVLTKDKIRDKFGLKHDIPVVGLAFSLGGLILANYCGEEGLRAMRARGLKPDDMNTSRYPPNLDANGKVLYNYGAGRQPIPPPVTTNGVKHAAQSPLSRRGVVRNGTLAARVSSASSIEQSQGGGENAPLTATKRMEAPDTATAATDKEALNALDAAITVSSPHNLLDGDLAMNTLVTRSIYGTTFSRNLFSFYERHKHTIQQLQGIKGHEALFTGTPLEVDEKTGEVKKRSKPLMDCLRTVRDFDNYVTAPHFGFNTCFEYYNWADNFKTFPFSVGTKLMSVVAVNDPICGPPQALARYEEAAVRLEENRRRLSEATTAACMHAHRASLPPVKPASPRTGGDPTVSSLSSAAAVPAPAASLPGHGVSLPSLCPISMPGRDEDAPASTHNVSPTLYCEQHVNEGGFVHVEFPVGGHLGFVSTPLSELLGRPNEMERFVARSLESVVSHWYSDRGLGADYMNDNDDHACHSARNNVDSDGDCESFSNAGG